MAIRRRPNIPRQYNIALNTAEHRIQIRLEAARQQLIRALTVRGITGEQTATLKQLQFVARLLQRLQGTVWRDTARIVAMNNFDAAVAAVNLHDLDPTLRQSVLDQLASAQPTYFDVNAQARQSMDTTTKWMANLLQREGDGSADDLAAAVTDWVNPSTPGGLSYATQAFVQWNLSNTFHDAQVETADLQGIATVYWRLDPGHPEEDICDDYADQEFFIQDVPDIPHRGCLCSLEPGRSLADVKAEDAAKGITTGEAEQVSEEEDLAGPVDENATPSTDNITNPENLRPFQEMANATIKGAVEVSLATAPDTVKLWAEVLRQNAGPGAVVRIMKTPSGAYTYHVFR